MPDICHYEPLEKEISNMVPIFIENLGSPKAVVRKSTHKCIGTFVKLTKKLEGVLRTIVKCGLENSNSRTRQHSMLVIPALMSLKSSIVEKESSEIKDLIIAVIKRIQTDQSEIVSKTGKKLLLELNKCYPNSFKQNQIDKLESSSMQQLCGAIISNDEQKVQYLLSNSPDLQFDSPVKKLKTNKANNLEIQKEQPLKQSVRKPLDSKDQTPMAKAMSPIEPEPTMQLGVTK